MDQGALQIPYKGTKSCSSCGDGLIATTVWASGRPGRRPAIPAWCTKAEHFFENLPLDIYGHHFNMARSTKASQPTDYRINQRRRFEVLERDGFACVYCREPASVTQIQQARAIIAVPAAALMAADGAPGMYKIGEPESKTFFGHDVDHLFTPADRALLKGHVDNDVDRNIRDRWVVTGCMDCNNGRKGSATPYRTLISIYARHLFENVDEPDWDDFGKFVSTLKLLRHLRAIAAKKAV